MSGSDDHEAKQGQNDGDVSQELRSTYSRLQASEMLEPPDLVDQAILNRARAAVRKPHSSRPWSFGWAHALSTAAVIVLGLTVMLQMREQVPLSTPAQQSLPAPVGAPAMPAATQVAPAAPPADADNEPGVTTQLRRSRAEDSQAINATPERIQGDATASGMAHDTNRSAAKSAEEAISLDASALRETKDEITSQEPYSDQGSPEEQNNSRQNTPSRLQQNEPAAWLAEIRRLQEAGLTLEAAEELARFRQQWPDMVIPQDLDPILNLELNSDQQSDSGPK